MGAWIEEPLYSAVPVEDIHETVDGRHVFWLDDLDDGRIRVVWDGLAGEPLGGLEPFQDGTRLAASRNGRHLCYYAGGNGQIRIGLDDTLGPPFDSVTRSVPPSVSDVTGRLAYGAYLDGVPRLIVDHARDPRSTAPLAPYPVVWSPDGTRLAWVEQETSEPAARQRVVVDGVEGPWAKGISIADWGLQFSPDSRRVAYYAIMERAGHYVVDGEAGPTTEESKGFAWSPDSRRFAYDALMDGAWHIVDNGRVGPALRGAYILGFDQLGRLAWFASEDGKRVQVVVEGRPDPAQVDVGVPTFAPDGRRGYAITEPRSGILGRFRPRQRMTIDGVPCDEHTWDDIAVVLFESPSMPPIYRSRARGAEHVVANGDPGPGFALILGPIASSSAHWAYLGLTEDGATLVVDGRALTTGFEPITVDMDAVLLFLPDGERVAWVAETDRGRHPAIGDQLGPAFDGVLPPHFDVDGTVYWHATRDRAVLRILYRD